MDLKAEDKAEAVKSVAGSMTFHRSDVLKSLLEYLHAQTVLGRANEVTESEIAINVMGRGARFSPESDSSVRTRFLALRKKLDEYYAGEGRDSSVRLDIPRGTYTLRFVPNVPAVVEPETVKPLVPEPPPVPATPKVARSGWIAFVAGFTLATILLAGAYWITRPDSAPDKLLTAAWGPMLKKGGSVTIAIGTPPSFFVRDFGDAEPPVGDPNYRIPFVRDKAFEEWYRSTRNLPLGKTALLHPNAHSPLWGDAAAASVISRMLGEHGAAVELSPSARVHPVALRERNTVIIGRPEYTDAAKAFLPEDALTVEYSMADRSVGVHNRAPKPGEPAWWFPSDQMRHKLWPDHRGHGRRRPHPQADHPVCGDQFRWRRGGCPILDVAGKARRSG